MLLTEKEGQSQYVFIKIFNTFRYNQTLNPDRKHFCRYYLKFFSTSQILEIHANDYFGINWKQIIKKDEIVKLKNYTRKIKSPFMTLADFQNILIPENNENQTKMSQNLVACSYGYKLVHVDHQFSKFFTSYLG